MSRQSFDRTAEASALVDYLRYVEPPHNYVHDASSSVVHHQDYLNRHEDQALCGAAFAYSVAYTARCAHALGRDERSQPGTFQHLVSTHGRGLLDL